VRLMEMSHELPPGVKAPVAQPMPFEVADSAASAPGWRELDVAYSCVPDVAYPWDPQIMKAIREFAPDAVPVWVQWVFLSPSETGNPEVVVFGRHALGRTVRNLTSELEPFRCVMPSMPCQGLTFERPNRIWFIHEGAPNPVAAELPGSFLPFDGSILDRAKRSAVGFRMTEKEFVEFMRQELIGKKEEEKKRRSAEIEDDMAQREKDFSSYADKQWEKISEVEAKEYQRARGTTLRERR
jgi:hypothetical protein